MAKQYTSYTEIEGINRINLTFREIIENWDLFHELFVVIYNWSSFRLKLNKKIVEKPFMNFYQILYEVKNCYDTFRIYNLREFYCNKSPWGCLKLKSICLNPQEWGNFWYCYGHFSEDSKKWIVHKKEIEIILKKEIENKKLFSCPVFDERIALAVISEMPDQIIVDNKQWFIRYEKRFVKDKLKKFLSIYHIVTEEELKEEIEFHTNHQEQEENPFEEGTDEWTNWIIEYYLKNKSK